MAIKKNAKKGYVEITVPRGYENEDPNFLVSINGKNYIIPRGKPVMVPRFVKKEYDRSIRAAEIMDNHIDEMIANTKF